MGLSIRRTFALTSPRGDNALAISANESRDFAGCPARLTRISPGRNPALSAAECACTPETATPTNSVAPGARPSRTAGRNRIAGLAASASRSRTSALNTANSSRTWSRRAVSPEQHFFWVLLTVSITRVAVRLTVSRIIQSPSNLGDAETFPSPSSRRVRRFLQSRVMTMLRNLHRAGRDSRECARSCRASLEFSRKCSPHCCLRNRSTPRQEPPRRHPLRRPAMGVQAAWEVNRVDHSLKQTPFSNCGPIYRTERMRQWFLRAAWRIGRAHGFCRRRCRSRGCTSLCSRVCPGARRRL